MELTGASKFNDANETIKLVRNEIRALGSPQASASINGDKIASGWAFPIESALDKERKRNASFSYACHAIQ